MAQLGGISVLIGLQAQPSGNLLELRRGISNVPVPPTTGNCLDVSPYETSPAKLMLSAKITALPWDVSSYRRHYTM